MFGRSNREGRNINQNHCTGKGGHDDEMEDPKTQSPTRRPMRGSEMPQVPPARASACKPSESVDSGRISKIVSLIIIHDGHVALTQTKAKKFWLPSYLIPPQRTAKSVAWRAAERLGLRIRTGTSQAEQDACWNRHRWNIREETRTVRAMGKKTHTAGRSATS